MDNKNFRTITINVDDAMLERLAREGERMKLANELSDLLKRIHEAGFILETRDPLKSWEESRRENLFSDKISIPMY